MRKFLIKISLFFIPLVIILGLLEYSLRSIPNSHKKKMTLLHEKVSEIETLILGNSHTYYGLNPKYFDSNCFNLANPSQSIDIDFRFIKIYIDQLKNLNTIVLPVSYASYNSNLESTKEAWRAKNYNIYCGFNVNKNINYQFEILSNKPKYIFKKLNQYYLQKDSITLCSDNGWGKDYAPEKSLDLFKTGKEVAEIQSNVNHSIFEENTRYLAEIISICKKKNINVILITCPSFKTYYNNLDDLQLNSTIKTAQKIALENSNCSYYNYLKDSNFLNTDFYDASHLNFIGAEKFSKLINERISDY